MSVSLKQAYTRLWTAVQDFDLGVSVNNYNVELAFSKLMGYKFKDIVPVFNDYMRKLVANTLGFKYLPYTERQLEALTRVQDVYPDDEKVITLFNSIKKQCDELINLIGEIDEGIVYIRDEVLIQELSPIHDDIYKLDEKYLWILYPVFKRLYNALPSRVQADNTVSSLMFYIDEHVDETQREQDFTSMIVGDISTLLIYNYPHPEMVLAVEKIKRMLPLIFGDNKSYTKLFVNDIDATIERYLAYAGERIDKRLLELYTVDDSVLDEKITMDEEFEELSRYYRQYSRYGKYKREFYERFHRFYQYPLSLLENYPTFFDMVKFVKRLTY